MSYVERNLMKNEKVQYRATLHWWIFAFPVLLLIIGLVMVTSDDSTTSGAGWAVIIFGAIGIVRALIRKATSEFVVTNKRVMLKTGWINRNSNEVVLNKAEGMNIDQGVLGRILGFGSIVITSGGATNRYKTIQDPLQFRKEINEQIEESSAAIPQAI